MLSIGQCYACPQNKLAYMFDPLSPRKMWKRLCISENEATIGYHHCLLALYIKGLNNFEIFGVLFWRNWKYTFFWSSNCQCPFQLACINQKRQNNKGFCGNKFCVMWSQALWQTKCFSTSSSLLKTVFVDRGVHCVAENKYFRWCTGTQNRGFLCKNLQVQFLGGSSKTFFIWGIHLLFL